MASFGGGVGDIVIVSKICLSLYQACTKGRKGAPRAVLDLANELWACSTALDQLSAAVSRPPSTLQTPAIQTICTRMISGCRSSLEILQRLIDKYEDIIEDSSSFDGRRWIRKFRTNVMKSRWMLEDEVQRIRNRIEANVQALNLLLNIATGNTLRDVNSQLEKLHVSVKALSRENGSPLDQTTLRTKSFDIPHASQNERLASSENSWTAHSAEHVWQSVITDCLIISRSQTSALSLYNNYERTNQLDEVWESYHITLDQVSRTTTAVTAQDLDLCAPRASQCDLGGLRHISEFIEELVHITARGKQTINFRLPRLLSMIIIESVKPGRRVQDQAAGLEQYLHKSRLISQWLQRSREESIDSSTPRQNDLRKNTIAFDDYLALIKHIIGFWSWMLRATKMVCSPIYPPAMLDCEPQLLAFKRQIQESSRGYWAKARANELPGVSAINIWQDTLDSYSNKYFQNLSRSRTGISMRAWLKPVDEVEEERALQRSRQWPKTCQWIFSKASYCDWMLGVLPRILWCHARPGSGKSVLSSFLVQHFLDAGETCCFFPFRYNNEALRDPQNLLRTIAFQMAEQDPQILTRLTELSMEDLNVESARLGLLWQKIFCNGVFRSQSTEPIYWIIDALDEADLEELLQFLSLLSDLQISERPIKLLLFSRYNRDIAMRLSALPIAVSEVLPDDNIEDIRRYAKERLATSAIVLQDRYQSEILEAIVKKSSGTFLWVAKTVDALQQEELIADVLASIDGSAHTLSSLYDNIMNQMARMKTSQIKIAEVMLGWTTCAARPLSLTELAIVLKTDFGALTDVASTVKNICGQLLNVDKQQHVQANHMTVQEYLKSNARCEFRVDVESWDYRIASFCLETLSTSYDADDSDDEEHRGLCATDAQAFKEYACLFWHVQLGRTCSTPKRIAWVRNFLESSGGLCWLGALAIYERLDQTLAATRTLKAWAKTIEDSTLIAVLDKLQRLAARLGYTDDQYTGRLVNGLRQGNGNSVYANGDKYFGRWRGDVREGKGTCRFATGVIYEGTWSNDEFHGTGKLFSPDGCVYEGEWVSGRRDGFGVMQWTWTERFEYRGSWSKDRFHGLGTMIYYTGSKYVGDWADGREHGHGKITYWNGDSYEGEFEDGCEVGEIDRCGEMPEVVYDDDTKATATVFYSSGATYEGRVNEQGLPSGTGAVHATTGISWFGEFADGRANGDGYAVRPPEGRLIGPMRNFVAEGHFIDINGMPGGGKYTGELSDTAREGHGLLETAFKYDYEGEFHRNEMHGKGVRRYRNGDYYEGLSQDGCMEGYGKMTFYDGWIYRGLWQKEKKNGTGGILELPGWGKFEGTWVNDQIRSHTTMMMLDATKPIAGLP